MINKIINYYQEYWVLIFYIYPAIFCLIGYTIRTWGNIKKDKIRREETRVFDKNGKPKRFSYSPTDRVKDLLLRLIFALVPVLNITALVFDIGTDIIELINNKFKNILNKPMVKSYDKEED
jgi:hypothetical protein